MSVADLFTGDWTQFSSWMGLRLPGRAAALSSWINLRALHGLMPFDRRLLDTPKPWTTLRDRNGATYEGLNFVTADYLGLSTHLQVKHAAITAIQRQGTHSAGPSALAGMTDRAEAFANDLGDALHQPYVSLHSSGWSAGYDALRALVGPSDTVLFDAHINGGIVQGATAATRRVYAYRHLDLDHARKGLRRLRGGTANGSLFVATSSIFPMDGASADLTALQSLCGEFGATLIVDVAHDFGCIGAQGGGEMEVQSVLGKVDVIVGSLSKTFATNGGFIALRRADLRDYARTYSPTHVSSSALGPVQVAAGHAALKIVVSPEGAARRAALRRAVLSLRAALTDFHFVPLGTPGPIVSVPIGTESVARPAVRICAEHGVLLTLLEYPAAPRGKTRVRLQLMAGHEPILMPEVAAKIAESVCAALRSAHEKTFSATTNHV